MLMLSKADAPPELITSLTALFLSLYLFPSSHVRSSEKTLAVITYADLHCSPPELGRVDPAVLLQCLLQCSCDRRLVPTALSASGDVGTRARCWCGVWCCGCLKSSHMPNALHCIAVAADVVSIGAVGRIWLHFLAQSDSSPFRGLWVPLFFARDCYHAPQRFRVLLWRDFGPDTDQQSVCSPENCLGPYL